MISSIYFPYESGCDKLKGILSYIREKAGIDNLNRYVVSRGSKSNQNYNADNIVLGESFAGQEPDYNWCEVDFQKGRIWITNYTWRANTIDFFKKFQVLGSDDGIHWDIIDERETTFDTSNPTISKTFNCKNPLTRRIIKIHPLDTTWNNNRALWIHKLEFFGFYFSSKDVPIQRSCKIYHIISHFTYMFTNILL